MVFLISFFQTSRVGPTRLLNLDSTTTTTTTHSDSFEDTKASIDLWQMVDAHESEWATEETPSTVFETPLLEHTQETNLRVQSVYLSTGDVLVVPAFWWVATQAGGDSSVWVEVQAEGHFMARSLHAVLRNNVWLNPSTGSGGA